MPNDPAQEFDIWLRNEISLIRLDDSQFSEQVLKKITKKNKNKNLTLPLLLQISMLFCLSSKAGRGRKQIPLLYFWEKH